MNKIAKAKQTITQITEQINRFNATITDSAKAKPFKMMGQSIIDSMKAIKNNLLNEQIQSDEDNLRFPLRLEEKIATMNYQMQASDTRPTASMHAVYESLSQQIDAEIEKLNSLLAKEVPEFNKMAESYIGKAIGQ